MNLKSKIVGLIAGTAFALSLVAGVTAETTSVTLVDNTLLGTCTAAASTQTASFGTYTWDGAQYQPATGSGTAALVLTVTQTYGVNNTCDVSVAGTNLERATGTETISVSAISAAHGTGTPQTLTTTQALLMDNVTGLQTANLTLARPGTTLPSGAYSGTITFTTVRGS